MSTFGIDYNISLYHNKKAESQCIIIKFLYGTTRVLLYTHVHKKVVHDNVLNIRLHILIIAQ